ncbi:GUN4 domain-containing protein [Oculatella sp. FACHB-28]|uniref:GUN4 domain-containing protein n=1 Tax=Oculatella sp. FACHB-28 TaxID=2692845 RepID=UPI001686CB1C|nr:GUN4 domain-containing protein [Oculatella sp. FACHB-28]MBD2056451.1 GUN4 domain-containing protein [Oculatella sp. FACHB-28]
MRQLPGMLAFKTWWLLTGKSVAYYFSPGLLLLCVAVVALAIPKFPFKVVGFAFGLSSGLYLLKLGSNIAETIPQKASSHNPGDSTSRFISIDSGTYNESLNIHGDYVQGDKNIFNNFNFNQDLSSAVIKIKQLVGQVEKQVSSAENAQQRIVDDLATLMYHRDELKDKLYAWLNVLGFTFIADEIDAAEKIVEVATELEQKPRKQSFFELDKRYRKLKYLLKTAQWREADDETVRVIAKLMPEDLQKYRCTDIDVKEISRKQLLTINRLWLEASGGRFGFSVQKQIWLKILKYQYKNEFNSARSKYDIFVEAVGWSNEGGRIYHVDFDYLITNPKGHLPAKILFWENYNLSSNYCFLSECLFDDFMERNYSNVSFLPAWLRRYLLLD